MNRQEFLKLVSKEIHFIFDRKSIEKELNEHLEDSIEGLKQDGFSEEEAEMHAVAQMGAPEEIGQLLNKEHHPVLGYVWMITRIMLITAVILTFVIGFDSLQSALDVLYPSQNIGWRVEEAYPVRAKFETKTHKVTIDHVCRTEHNQFYITYRAKTKLDYLRSVSGNSTLFCIVDEEENTSITWGRFGEKGYCMFDWPEDDILSLQIENGRCIELDLGGYWK